MTIVKKTVATGKVIPRREVEVKAQVSGVVEKLYVAAGQTIKKGAIIARISLRPNMLNVSAAEAQVQSAKINLRNQTAEFERHKKLLAQKLISRIGSSTQFATNYDLQKEAVAAAENTLLLLKTGAIQELGQCLQHDSRHHRRHGARCANQGGRVHPRDQHVSVRHHARDAGRHERHDLRRPGRRIGSRQAASREWS